MRIASLLASGTEITCALGLGDDLVGISHECDYPPEILNRPCLSAPRFDSTGLSSGEIDEAIRAAAAEGEVYRLDVGRLAELEPDLIIAQAVCEVCAVPTSLAEQAAATLDGRTEVLSLDSHSIDGILGSILAVGKAAGVPHRADDLVADLRGRISAVASRVSDRSRIRVLGIEWLEPPFVPGHWVPEMIEAAGGHCLLGAPGKPSRSLPWDELSGHDPDLLAIMPCGYGLERSRAEADQHSGSLLSVAGRAIENGRAFVVDGSAYFNRSGPRMVDGVEILGALLHPECFPGADLEGKASRWYPG